MNLKKVLFLFFSICLIGSFSIKTFTQDRPCSSDVNKFCSSVKYKKGQLETCLQQHESQLSESCAKSRKTKQKQKEDLNEACGRDISSYCAGMTGGAKVRCLRENRDSLSKDCSDQISQVKHGTGRKRRAACRYEVNQFCSGVSGTEAIKNCLQNNLSQLSTKCAQTIEGRQDRVATTKGCEYDIDRFCSGIQQGKAGKYPILTCLRSHINNVTEGCRAELDKLYGSSDKDKDKEEKTSAGGDKGGDQETEQEKDEEDEDEDEEESDKERDRTPT